MQCLLAGGEAEGERGMKTAQHPLRSLEALQIDFSGVELGAVAFAFLTIGMSP